MEDNDLSKKLIDNEQSTTEYFNKDLNTEFFDTIFTNQNINEGNSLKRYKKVGINGFIKGLKSNEQSGLNSNDAEDINKRISTYGSNKKIEAEEKGIMYFIKESLEDQMLQILLLASVVSTIIGILQDGFATGWIEGFSIFLAVFVVVSISSFQNYSKEQQFNQLEEENAKKDVKLKRDGAEVKEISIYDIVVGDIMHLSIGDIVPADGILLSSSVTMDESAITGESDLQVKISVPGKMSKKLNPFIVSGTQVVDGSGKMLICAVGPNSSIGKADDIMGAENDETPLQAKLTIVADKIGDLGFLAAIFIGMTLIVKDIFNRYISGMPIFSSYLIDSLVNAFIIAITVIVVAIPEGLPMAVTISLAFSVFKMKEENNLVRHLDASETMGNVNNVCTDKTGTVTKGVMELRNYYLEHKNYLVNSENTANTEVFDLLIECLINNMSAYIETKNGEKLVRGDFTERSLLQFLINKNIDYDSKKHKKVVKVLAFSSENKFMSTIVETKPGNYRIYLKGAPDRIIAKCSKIRGEKGKIEDIKKKLANFQTQQSVYAENGFRTLCIAYKDFTSSVLESDDSEGLEFFEPHLKELTLLSVLGIADPPRDDVTNAIKCCNDAGVTVRMVTGDYIKTALSISQEVHIINHNEAALALNRLKALEDGNNGGLSMPSKIIALDGNEFKELTGGYNKIEDGKDAKNKPKYKFELANVAKFQKTTEHLKVIARASPDDKFLLVMGLKQLGNIVAVTGDGTNDAPAMKKSDVGFAMGKRGTDIAKAASDIVLLDDSFSSIVTAMKYGRNVYDCIRKFLQFQLTCNVVAVFMTLLGGCLLKDAPLNPIQMLWVNLIMDSFASLALATEPPSEKLLKRRPYPKESDIITPTMKVNIGAQSIYQIIVLLLIIFKGDHLFGVPSDRELDHFTWNKKNGYHFTIFFHIFVLLQVFNSINARKLQRAELNVFENIFNNWLYIFIQGVIITGQILMVQFGGRALRTQPLSIQQHLACIFIASTGLVVGFLVKFLPVGHDESEGVPNLSIAKSIRGRKSQDYTKVKSSKSIKI